jgi:hypothetical protein
MTLIHNYTLQTPTHRVRALQLVNMVKIEDG